MNNLKTQIDHYKSFENVPGGPGVEHLDPKAKEALYQGTNAVRTVSAREAFVKYLEQKQHDLPKANVAAGENFAEPISAVKFLGSAGLKLYKAALEEEMSSRSYRDAVFNQATKFLAGPRLEKRPIVIIAGPSASGKSYATDTIIEKLKEMPKKIGAEEGNYLACVDNGIGREVSQMRKLLIRTSNIYGYKGIKDLHANSDALTKAKKYVKNAANIDSKFGMVIPDTYAKWGKIPGVAEAKTQFLKDNMVGDRQVIFSEVIEDVGKTFKESVNFMGNDRAWMKGVVTLPLTRLDRIVLNDTKDLAESKKYGASGFSSGVSGSKNAMKTYLELAGDNALTITIKNDLILLKKACKKPERWEKATLKDQDAKLFSAKTYQAWQNKMQGVGLEEYAKTYFKKTNEQPETWEKCDKSDPKGKIFPLNIVKEWESSDKSVGLMAYSVGKTLICSSALESQCAQTKTKALPAQSVEQFLQHAYVKKLTQRAIDTAMMQRGKLLYDPQGRFLIELTLTNHEKEDFKEAFGKEPSKTTTLSIDVSNIPALHEDFKKQYGLKDAQIKQLAPIRGSIIPLQQELYFHLRLCSRVYLKMESTFGFVDNVSPEQMKQAHSRAMAEVNKLIVAAFQKALKKATKHDKLDDVLFIQLLDKARSTISSKAHELLLQEIENISGQTLTPELKNISQEDIKALAKVLTATSNDLLHIDNDLNLATWISGSGVSAHNRGEGEQYLADRQIVNVSLNEKLSCRQRLQIRVPSLDVKEGIPADQIIRDVRQKLNAINHRYEMKKNIRPNALGVKAFSYNLFTSLNDPSGDSKENKQSEGASHILQGAHQYNLSQLRSNGIKHSPVFCFVQNISVNGVGDNLGYKGNDLQKEVTLMSNLSLVHHLMDEKEDVATKSKAKVIFDRYYKYLNQENREPYFSQSQEGQLAMLDIRALKLSWVNNIDQSKSLNQDIFAQTKCALKNMMAHNFHYSHKFSKLFQSLSVFVEDASISGCKSGNEGSELINGRISVLDNAMQNPNSSIAKITCALATAVKPKQIWKLATQLKNAVDKKYDLHLQGAASLISVADQGGPSKLNAKSGFFSKLFSKIRSFFDKNHGEDSKSRLLHQNYAKEMQAHEGMAKKMVDAHKTSKARPKVAPTKQNTIVMTENPLYNEEASREKDKDRALIEELVAIIASVEDDEQALYQVLNKALNEIKTTFDRKKVHRAMKHLNYAIETLEPSNQDELNQFKEKLLKRIGPELIMRDDHSEVCVPTMKPKKSS